jgi:hypothetical protein
MVSNLVASVWPPVFVCLGDYNESVICEVAGKQQKFISYGLRGQEAQD